MRKFLWIFVLVGFSACIYATQQTTTNPMNPNWKMYNLYIGAEAGHGNTGYGKTWLQGKTGFTSVDHVQNSEFAARFFLGYEFNRYFALEAAYTYITETIFHDINGTKTNADMYQHLVDLFAKPMLPLGKWVSLFMKVGIGYVNRENITVTVSGTELDANSKDSTVMPALAGGFDIHITRNFFAEFTCNRYFKNGDIKAITFYGAGLAFVF